MIVRWMPRRAMLLAWGLLALLLATPLTAQRASTKTGPSTGTRRATAAMSTRTKRAAPAPTATSRRRGTATTDRAARQPRGAAAPAKGRARGASRPTPRTRLVPVVPKAPARPATVATTPFGLEALRADLGAMVGTSTRSGAWGALVVSLSQGDTLYASAPDVPRVPASTMKLFSSALALERLGPQWRFRTEVLAARAARDGVIEGDLVLRGDGDPTWSPRFFGGRPDAALDSLAQQVKRAGVARITGRVVADVSAFERSPVPDGWPTRILDDYYAGRVSALVANEGLVWATIRPTAIGQRAEVVLEPATSTLGVTATVRTVRGSGSAIRLSRSGDAFTVSGSIGVLSPQKSYIYVVHEPARFVAGAFREALVRAGITVEGAAVVGPAPATPVTVTTLESAPLETLVTVLNRESVNIMAEQVYRAAARGAERAGAGSAALATRAVREVLVPRLGVPASAFAATDGSGLSERDAITPRAMVHLLGWADRAPWSRLWHGAMPLAGESGTLRGRMRDTPARANLHAKTGTMNNVLALSGYVTARNGELLAFALFYNGTDRWRAREAMDAVGATLAGWAR